MSHADAIRLQESPSPRRRPEGARRRGSRYQAKASLLKKALQGSVKALQRLCKGSGRIQETAKRPDYLGRRASTWQQAPWEIIRSNLPAGLSEHAL